MTYHNMEQVYKPRLELVWHGSQIRSQLSAASAINRPQPKVMITIVIIKLKLHPAAGCEAKVGAKLSSRSLPMVTEIQSVNKLLII